VEPERATPNRASLEPFLEAEMARLVGFEGVEGQSPVWVNPLNVNAVRGISPRQTSIALIGDSDAWVIVEEDVRTVVAELDKALLASGSPTR